MKGTWQTDDSSGLPTVVLVVFAAVVVAAVAGPVLAALAALINALIMAALVILGVAAAATAGAVVYRVRHRASSAPPWRTQLPRSEWAPEHPRATQAFAQPRALPPPQQVNLHFHGVSAEDIAEAIRQARG